MSTQTRATTQYTDDADYMNNSNYTMYYPNRNNWRCLHCLSHPATDYMQLQRLTLPHHLLCVATVSELLTTLKYTDYWPRCWLCLPATTLTTWLQWLLLLHQLHLFYWLHWLHGWHRQNRRHSYKTTWLHWLHWLRDYAVYTDYTDYTAKITLLLTTVNYSDLLTKSTTPTSLNTSISLTTLITTLTVHT